MAIDPDLIYCANADCLAENPGDYHYCSHCGSGLVRRYLWVTGEPWPDPPAGTWLDDRYWVVGSRVLLDTRPGYLPLAPEDDIPEAMVSYLRLFPYRWAIPQIYGWLSDQTPNLFLLEDVPVQNAGSLTTDGQPNGTQPSVQPGDLLPRLKDRWYGAQLAEQVNWLWQIARLWNPLSRRKVGATLLDLDNLHLDGSLVRCRELIHDDRPMSLSELGQAWTQLLGQAREPLQPFLELLNLSLQTGKLNHGQALVQLLEGAIDILGDYQTYRITIASHTDAGPSRTSNEDNCFPHQGSILTTNPGPQSLAVVCDGLGGHEGGEVASKLAVNVLLETLQNTLRDPSQGLSTDQILRQAISCANDAINQQNNHEQRHERRRMGTTIVGCLAVQPWLYLANVGDSRAYAITPAGCRQITLDDDLASRNTRMGLGTYRQTQEIPGAGALVQALGMVASTSLVIDVQRLFLTEDFLVLLCSDGVSDRDLLDRIWSQELGTVIHGNISHLDDVAYRLVEVANQKNGHDNATACLVHVSVTSTGEPESQAFTGLFAQVEARNQAADLPTMVPPLPSLVPTQLDAREQPEDRLGDDATMRQHNPPDPDVLITQPPPYVMTTQVDGAIDTESGNSTESKNSTEAQPLLVFWVLVLVTIVALLLGTFWFYPLWRSLTPRVVPSPSSTGNPIPTTLPSPSPSPSLEIQPLNQP